ncbi:hypothetical protein K435DRAFT_665756 [Dendrothele bispora CBS 962.96]|uniref:Uncharacterized protein n=1 Tax=Dendrothele bispora (strain CBS 962.96) TaxID=1314807 RepID=A0A4S8M263_DENBC|nr:hypothetical protein K435DRAFT_665756 [Dendrothele bispora CBS 962.96]
MARRSLFEAHLETEARGSNSTLSAFSQLLQGSRSMSDSTKLTELQEAKFFKTAKFLSESQYIMLLDYIHLEGPPWPRSWKDPNPPIDAFILPPSGATLHSFTNNLGYTFSTFSSHKGNSAIQFYSNRTHTSKNTGFIQSIWQIPLHSQMRTFFFIEAHKALPFNEAEKAPYRKYPHLMSTLVDADKSGKWVVVEEKEIIAHAVVYPRPPGTYQIPRKTMVVCWSLNRGRR